MKVYFNEDKGTTVAVFDNTQWDGYKYIRRRTRNFADFNPGLAAVEFPHEIRAKVKLHEGDKWDEKIGMREALHKADLIHRAHLDKYIRRWMVKVVNALDSVDSGAGIFDEVLEKRKKIKEGKILGPLR